MEGEEGWAKKYKYKTAFSAILAAGMLNPATAHDQKQASLWSTVQERKKYCTTPSHIQHHIYIMRTVLHRTNSFLLNITSLMEVSSWKNNTITIKLMPVMPQPHFHIINQQRGVIVEAAKDSGA